MFTSKTRWKLLLEALFLINLCTASFAHSSHSFSNHPSSSNTFTFLNWNKYKNEKPTKNPAWDAAWKVPSHHGWAWGTEGRITYALARDPAKSSDYVIEAIYPKGSENPAHKPQGGFGFYASPLPIKSKIKTLAFEYQVYFPDKFNFVLGGKLPGLFANKEACTGGDDAVDCFSTRFMWRQGGKGELYAYIDKKDQKAGLCKAPKNKNGAENVCNPVYGISIGRGAWVFKTGTWNTIKQVFTMNSAGQQNGVAILSFNGKQVFKQDGLVFLKTGDIKTVGIAFHTFFGGSQSQFITPIDQKSYFKNFTYTLN